MKLSNITHLPPPSLVVSIVTSILATGFLIVGLSEVISPQGWDGSYGVALTSGEGFSFVRAVGARNIGLSLIALFAALTGMRAALASVFFAIALIAAMDFYIVSSAVGLEHAIKYAVFILLMAGIAL